MNPLNNQFNFNPFVETSKPKKSTCVNQDSVSLIGTQKLCKTCEQISKHNLLDKATELKRSRPPSPDSRKKPKIEKYLDGTRLANAEKEAILTLDKRSNLTALALKEDLEISFRKGDFELTFALLQEGRKRGVKINKFCYNVLLRSVKKQEFHIDFFRAILETMRNDGIYIDGVNSEVIQECYMKKIIASVNNRMSGRSEQAHDLLNEMMQVPRCDPHRVQVAHGLVIKAYVEDRNLDKALTIYDSMVGNPFFPDKIIYMSLFSGYLQAIDDYVQANKLGMAYERLKEMALFKNKVDDKQLIGRINQGYIKLIDAYITLNDPIAVAQLFQEMGSNPDFILANSLIHFFFKNGIEDIARKLFAFIKKDCNFEIQDGAFDCHFKSAGTSYLAIETHINNLKRDQSLRVITGKGLHRKNENSEMFSLQKQLIKFVEERHADCKITIDESNPGLIYIKKTV